MITLHIIVFNIVNNVIEGLARSTPRQCSTARLTSQTHQPDFAARSRPDSWTRHPARLPGQIPGQTHRPDSSARR